MFKRANKMTALLVAAAAVVSLVPATGVNAADVKRIESKDGTVYDAVAYKDGAAVIDGNVVDTDTDAVYFLNQGKYAELEDLDSGSELATYGEKYASVDTDDCYVDLTTGKVIDESVEEDAIDDAQVELRSKIRRDNDDRFDDDKAKAMPSLTKMKGADFGTTWYETDSYGKAVYTDAKGNYIDADYNVGKIKVSVTSGTSVETVTVNNTKDSEEFKNNGKAKVDINSSKVIGQDAKNIYRTAELKVTADADITAINGLTIAGKTAFNSTDKKAVTFTVIQKISKEQASDDIDGIKYAKSVANYVVSDEDGKKVNLDGKKFTIADGKVIVYTEITDGKVDADTIELKTDRSYTYTKLTDADDIKATVVDVDAEGNLWKLEAGYVSKFNNDEDWDKVYKVDGSMDQFSVYNKDNMVVWSKDDEVYSVIGGKADTTDETTVETVKGWAQAADGTWTYVKEDGTKATGWLNLNGTWYFLKADGVMATAWINDNGTWYYTNASGAMQTGWVNDNGTWYFCNASGAMQANTTIDGYVLGANGAWIR